MLRLLADKRCLNARGRENSRVQQIYCNSLKNRSISISLQSFEITVS